jgi:hypothetical protein
MHSSYYSENILMHLGEEDYTMRTAYVHNIREKLGQYFHKISPLNFRENVHAFRSTCFFTGRMQAASIPLWNGSMNAPTYLQ